MSHPQAQCSLIPCPFLVLNMIIVAASLLQLPGFGLAVDERYANCGNVSCGNMNVTFPLWIAGGEDYCGHPSYEVECQEGVNLVATMRSQKYKVIEIVREKQSLTVVRMDLLENACPQQEGDFLVDYSLFNYTASDLNVTLFYDCTSQSSTDFRSFNCSMDNGPQSNLLGTSSSPPNDYGQPVCSSSMTAPVLKSSYSDLVSNAIGADQVLKGGFEVRWTLSMGECTSCIASGGRCGINRTTEKFSCFCSNGTYESICPVLAAGVPTNNQAPAPEALSRTPHLFDFSPMIFRSTFLDP
ncbi:hypothetical protein SAY87_003293 [Trapa incisa]|uniref:non-specific serine/threonine protein kinase n=1 Tax=Trapa incisa TaxID=236973 RepID=A0AAN7QHJ8_9MYRT|nr:hypothetical protein SAY87_003293 [Trapa incisa]